MKAYLAAAYQRRNEMAGVAHVLRTFGHEVTSTWVDQPGHDGPVQTFEQTLVEYDVHAADCGVYARRDLIDVERADTLIAFTDGELARGGRHVEFGYALGRNIRMIVVGPREVIFHTLPQVEWFPNWARFVIAMSKSGELELGTAAATEAVKAFPIYRDLLPGA